MQCRIKSKCKIKAKIIKISEMSKTRKTWLIPFTSRPGPQDHRATGLQGYRATGLQSYRATGLQGYRATRLQGYRATGLQGYRATVLQGYRVRTAEP